MSPRISLHYLGVQVLSSKFLLIELPDIVRLTTASLSGGWVPGVSKGFHFWQPAPRMNNAPMTDTTLQPSYEPPHTRDKKQAPVTLKIQWKERGKKGKGGGGGGGERDDCSRPHWLKKTPHTAGPTSHERNVTLLRMCFQTDLWPQVLLELSVINSFKLRLNAFKHLSTFYDHIISKKLSNFNLSFVSLEAT